MNALQIGYEFASSDTCDFGTDPTQILGLTACFHAIAHLHFFTARFALPCHQKLSLNVIILLGRFGNIQIDPLSVKEEFAGFRAGFGVKWRIPGPQSPLQPACSGCGLAQVQTVKPTF